jgi:ribonuclease P protein component
MWSQHRLSSRSDFERLKKEGRVQTHSWFLLSYAPNTLSYNRYGFITGKRLGKAVTRNRTRRLLKEAVRHTHPHLSQGYDVVLVARSGLVGRSYAEVLHHVRKLFEQAGLAP